MRKNFVLDTNIMIHDPSSLLKFEDNNIYIPSPVVEELDNLKNLPGETGYNAREATRVLKSLRKDDTLANGVKLPGGGKLMLFLSEDLDNIPRGWDRNKADNQILSAAKALRKKLRKPVILVSNDANMQIKADIMEIPVQEYRNDRIAENINLYTGRRIITVTDDIDQSVVSDLHMNEYVQLNYSDGTNVYGRYDGSKIVPLKYQNSMPCGLMPRNAGQAFLQEALMLPAEEAPLVICAGAAGTGKTLFALGCGLEQVMESHAYKRVLVCRPHVTLGGEDLGALPGSEFEKISPLLRSSYDNLEILFGNRDDTNEMLKDKIHELFQREYITAEAIAYIRGRSITNTFIIIDEAQNATPNQILSIITRCGEGSKIALLGDPAQIDTPRLDSRNNGLVTALQKLYASSPLVHVTTFTEEECVRSQLAKLAASKLKQ